MRLPSYKERMLSVVINFATSESQLLSSCIAGVKEVADEVIVSVCDHFFDGTPEDRDLLEAIYCTHPDVHFVQYPFSEDNFYGCRSPHFWHNMGRLVGAHFAKGKYLLFLDADEVVEGEALQAWLPQLEGYAAAYLAVYWYIGEPSLRAEVIEQTSLIVKRSALRYEALMHAQERAALFHFTEGKKLEWVGEEAPMVHHYSWVRSKEALLRKVSSWGHRSERNWLEVIEKGFSGEDFVHGYPLKQVEPRIVLSEYDRSRKGPKNVTCLSKRDVHKIDLELLTGESF